MSPQPKGLALQLQGYLTTIIPRYISKTDSNVSHINRFEVSSENEEMVSRKLIFTST